jgi:hypothetical protein
MTSYLNNLMLRNQQAREVVRPRLPSIFEPPAALPFVPATLDQVASLAGDSHRDQAIESEALSTRREHEPLMKPQSQPRRHDPATHAQTIPAWRGLQVIAEAQRISVPPLTEVYAYEPTAQTSADQSAHSTNVSSATARGGRVQSADVTAGTEERTSGGHQPERDIRQRSQPDSPALAPHDVTALFSDFAAKLSAVTDRSAHTADRRIIGQPRVSPLAQPADESSKHHTGSSQLRHGQVVPRPLAPLRREQVVYQAAEPPMPTINVTIGRIEVKASPPAAAPPQPRKPQPTLMSLDEYMRRRNDGGDSR